MPEDLLKYGLIPEFIGRLPDHRHSGRARRGGPGRILVEPQERPRQAVPEALRARERES